jgi:hypothetical protein
MFPTNWPMWATVRELLLYVYTSSHTIVNDLEPLRYVYNSSHIIVKDLELLRYVYTSSHPIVNDLESLRYVCTLPRIILCVHFVTYYFKRSNIFGLCVYLMTLFKSCINSSFLQFRSPFLWITTKNANYNTSNKLSTLSSIELSKFHRMCVVYGSL